VLAFGAGFSERWAQDTLTGGLTGRGRANDDAVAASAVKAAASKPAAQREQTAEVVSDLLTGE